MTKVRFSAYRWWVALFAILSPHALGANAGTDARRVGFSPSNTYIEAHGHDGDALAREIEYRDWETKLKAPLSTQTNPRQSILKSSASDRIEGTYVPLRPDAARGAVGQRATFSKDRTQHIAAMPESDQRRKKEEALQPFRYWRSVGKQLQAGDTVKTIEEPHKNPEDRSISSQDLVDLETRKRQTRPQGGHLPQTPLLRLQIEDLHEHPDTGNPPLRNKWTKDTPERRQQTVKNWSSFYDIPSSPPSS